MNSTIEHSSSSSTRSKKPPIQPSDCRVCGATAKYSYFGVIACQPCKMFFKRNGPLAQENFVCRYEGHCDINVNNRHTCNACRLKKCFDCGMTIEKFRASVQTKKKKSTSTTIVDQRTLVAFNHIPTLNLLRADQSTLTSNQWTLISNLLSSYEETAVSSVGDRLIQTRQAEDITLIFPSMMIQELIGAMYISAGDFIHRNGDLSQLNIDDRSVVVRSAADRVSSMGGLIGLGRCNLFGYTEFSTAITPIYGASTVAITMWAMKFFNPDIFLMKLGLALYAVSENIVSHPEHPFSDLEDPIAVWNIQNRYAEVTWKYLLYRYGYRDAVKQFLSLTSFFIAMSVLTVQLQDVSRHTSDVTTIVEQTEIKLILDDVERIMEEDTA